MNAYFKNNLKQAFLTLEGEEIKDDFQIFMLQENEISGLLKTNIKYIDGHSHYQYDISGKVSMKVKYEKMKLNNEDIKSLIHSLLQTLQEIEKYMLDAGGILLTPEYIYCEGDKYFFCFYPPCSLELKEEFHKLTEFFVREVDYQDKEGIHLAYTLHKSSMDENYSIEKIMEEVLNEEEASQILYEKRMEEQAEETVTIAEKKELWEPVKRFLEKRKKDRWDSLDDIAKEQSGLFLD